MFLELTTIWTLWYGKIYWTSSKGISRGIKGDLSWLHTTIYNRIDTSRRPSSCSRVRAQHVRNDIYIYIYILYEAITFERGNGKKKGGRLDELQVAINNESCAQGCNGIATDASLGLEYNLAQGIIASVRGSYELGRLIGRWLDLSCARLTGLGVREQSYNFSPFHFPSIRLFFTSSVIKIGEIISRFATIRYDMVPQRCTFFFYKWIGR